MGVGIPGTGFRGCMGLARLGRAHPGLISLGAEIQRVITCIVCLLPLRVQDGSVRLPDVTITDKNDTFHLNGGSFSSFRCALLHT